MKKSFIVLLVIMTLICFPVTSIAKKKTTSKATKTTEKAKAKTDTKTEEETKTTEKVKVYMLTKNGCPACSSAEEYFKGLLESDPEAFDLVILEVFDGEWKFTSDAAETLFNGVYELIGEETSNAATPTIVIGDYSSIGLPKDTEVITKAIKNAKGKEDKIQKLATSKKIDLTKISTPDNKETEEKTGKYDTLIVLGIFAVVIGCFAGLVIAGKKS